MVCELLRFSRFYFCGCRASSRSKKPYESFCGVKLSWMVSNLRKLRKFNSAKVKAYTVYGMSGSVYCMARNFGGRFWRFDEILAFGRTYFASWASPFAIMANLE